MSASVRLAVASDAPSMAAIGSATDGSDVVVEEANARSLVRSEFYAGLVQKHAASVYVVEVGGSVVGFVVLQQESHHTVVGQNPVKLWQLYVAPAHHGSGVASQLMSVTMDHARKHLHDVVWLGVSEHNARGIAFYRKHGFKALGLHEVGAGGHAHQDIVMSCAAQ
jgi:ribosomal protein S18 acetylase RimI-like enzyme